MVELRIKIMLLVPVILCGGSGSRLWPLSREQNPKPFLRLTDGLSLIQHAFTKAGLVGNADQIITVANKELFFRVKSDFDELEELSNVKNTYILEPEGRNTAPAITMAALEAQKQFGDDVCLLVLAADHLIDGDEKFSQAITKAVELAKNNRIVTFGIEPTAPETGYGYIHFAGNEVKQFVEKPNETTAKQYVSSGEYLWNSGMFCFQPKLFLQELEQSRSDILQATTQAYEKANVQKIGDVTQIYLTEEFASIPSESVDYAVMEKSKNISVVPCQFGWSDVGSWTSLAEVWQKDNFGNAVKGEVIIKDVRNSVLYSDHRLIAGIGLEDLIVIDTDDAILIADRNQCQDVKAIYTQLKDSNHESYKIHTTAHRPWGTYTVLEEAEGYKVKRIVVYPNAKLSLQHHHHRSEHWIVVTGEAEVVNGDQTLHLTANQSTYIKQGDIHRLTNIGSENLVLIEVQCGSYLGEDDIVRHQDDYQRV